MARASHSKTSILAALGGNVLVAATKFAAAWYTGSSAMLSEAVHSLVDTLNEILLLYGMRASARQPDSRHPMGYGRELYFWSFVVAVLVFALGAGVSVYEGVRHLQEPAPSASLWVAYVVLGLSLLFEGTSLAVALRAFRKDNPEGSLWGAIRRSKDPSGFTVLLEDSAAVLGILVALAGTALQQALGRPEFDGWSSILIGLVLAGTAALLARETKALLIGEAASPAVLRRIRTVLSRFQAIDLDRTITLHLGPREIVAAIALRTGPGMTAAQLEASLLQVQRAVQEEVPEVRSVYLRPATEDAPRVEEEPAAG